MKLSYFLPASFFIVAILNLFLHADAAKTTKLECAPADVTVNGENYCPADKPFDEARGKCCAEKHTHPSKPHKKNAGK
ncbi:hypothetical protein AAVH_18814 [Aphelenchoides avenae]|nr:hypothetical protein AAVH_18814 [Aphelenchus avenae]